MDKLFRLLRYDWPLHFVLLLTNWLPDNVIFLRLRGSLMSPFIGSCGKNFRAGRNLLLYDPQNIRIGDNVYLAYGVWLSARTLIEIKDDVTIGPYCVLSSSNHARINNTYSNEFAIPEPVVIGKGCWLGAHCVITAGCKVGAGSLLGAGAVVVNNIPSNVMAAGVPAKTVKTYES